MTVPNAVPNAAPMRILQLLGHGGVGGTETFAISLAQGLIDRGHDVTLANTWTDSPMNALASSSGVPFVVIPGGGRRIGWRWFREVYRYLRGNQFDLVQTYGLRVSLGLRMMQNRVGRFRHIMGVRGLDQQRTGFQAWMDRRTESRLDLIICNAQAVADRRKEVVGTPSSRILVIPNGIDTSHFSPEAPSASRGSLGLPDGFLFVMVASFRLEKDHPVLFEAFAKVVAALDGSGLALVGGGSGVGGGAGRGEAEARVRELGLADRVIFLGAMKDVRPVVRSCDAFVLSSYSEGMPRALMEAMALGTPVVSTRAGGVEEVATDEADALLVPTRDAEALARAMIRMARDAALRERLSKAGVERIRGAFSQDAVFDRYEAVYRSVVEGVAIS